MYIGLDIGYSAVKLAYGRDKLPETTTLPVGAAPIADVRGGIDGQMNLGSGQLVMVNEVEWAAGLKPSEIRHYTRVMDENYPKEPRYLALARAALATCKSKTVDCLVTGLPVAQWNKAEERAALTSLLEGRHYIRHDLVVDVKNVRVIPQPSGALTSHMMTQAGLAPANQIGKEESVLIVDPGHYSMDWVVVHEGSLNTDAAGSTFAAGDEIVSACTAALQSKHGNKVNAQKIERALLAGSTSLTFGVDSANALDFRAELEAEADKIVSRNLMPIKASIRSVMKNSGVDVVLVTGGCADLFAPALRRVFPDSRVVIAQAGVMANAKGFYLMARYASRAQLRSATA